MSRRFRFLTEDQILRLQQRQLTPSVILTVVLALRVFFAPIMPQSATWLQPLAHAMVAAGLVYMAATTRRHLLLAGGLGTLTVALEFGQLLVPALSEVDGLQSLIFAILLVYVFWLMLHDLFTARSVDATTLLLAVNCYLVIGILWTVFYVLVEATHSGSFLLAGDLETPIWQQLYYFSFVTLTTLGYGDIQPVSPLARSLAMFEAVGGVLFTGLLVARLVGMYGARENQD